MDVAEVEKLIKYEDSVILKDRQLFDANTKLAELDKNQNILRDVNNDLIDDNKELAVRVNKQDEIIKTQKDNIDILSEKIKQPSTFLT